MKTKQEYYKSLPKVKELYKKTLQVKKSATEAKTSIDCVTILSDYEILKDKCIQDFNTLQILGLQFMSKMDYIRLSHNIIKLRKQL